MYVLILIIMLIYIYAMQFSYVDASTCFLDTITNFKTGDIILFKACNNANAILIGNYYTHIGIIYVTNGIPYIFEACGIEYMPLKPHHNVRGIFLTPLLPRISKYKGTVYWKRLEHELSVDVCNSFKQFIDYAIENMYYNYSFTHNALSKLMGEKYTLGTNCGELVLLSLIKLQLLPIESFDAACIHSLKLVSYLELVDNNKYLPLVKIIDHPFDI